MGLEATPTTNTLPFRAADFSCLAEALDYAAQGVTGCNFNSGRGELYTVLSYAQLREEAQVIARRLLSLGVERGARVALIAETHPDFLRMFFACQYIGLVPVPLPIPISLGSHDAYVTQLRGMIQSCGADIAVSSRDYLPFLEEATEGLEMTFVGVMKDLDKYPESSASLCPSAPTELAYIQYTSGSTRFPRGVMITQETVLSNLSGIIKHGLKMGPSDRFVSWLPFYHDMGFVGLVLVPLTSQVSVDYLGTRDFAMRPRQWLSLMSRSRATISFGPPFGYELVERCLRPEEASSYDLSAWRVAGVGAEMIRAEPLLRFAKALEPSGFDARAFAACYGMAECSLATSFAPLSRGLEVDRIDADHLAKHHEARPVPAEVNEDLSPRLRSFVLCGKPLPEFDVEIRDEDGRALPDRHSGTIFLRGPSVMSGYYGEPEITSQTLSQDGWLNTGDIGYRLNGELLITGRKKDLIIINGRNILPQDLEYLAEQQPEVRTGDALAFSAPGPQDVETTVMVVQCREKDPAIRANLEKRLKQRVRSEVGIDVYVELVPLHTLPRTSSGKLSRSKARQNFIESHDWDAPAAVVAGDQ